ncbi:MAG TPA: S8 family serine peptidase [Gammaproteobacteria bacterium]|nr:S8 family serine peptidase [Gammaproteobacteria bacterium]
MRFWIPAATAVAFGVAAAGFAATTAVSPPSARALMTHPVRQAASPPAAQQTRYIVRFKGAPVPLYAGSGTRSPLGASRGVRRTEAFTPAELSYARDLKARHTEFLQRAAGLLKRPLTPHFTYRYALNGMSVSLTRAEAVRLANLPDVASVEPVRYLRPSAAQATDTGASRAWIDTTAVWALPTATTDAGPDTEGEGIVVADIDTGINSANDSFAAMGPVDGYAVQDPLGSGHYLGVCDPTNTDQAAKKPSFFACNDKLIGAYTYTSGKNDPNSPEDSEGHGSHTASTAAGDLVSADLNGAQVPLSGVAPHANLIVYDVCDPTDTCATDKIVAAINQVIKDKTALAKTAGFKGMVLNLSIGGGGNPYVNAMPQALLAASEAGIYVAAAGGNGGPSSTVAGDSTLLYPVEHMGPWVTTVAASTHDGTFSNRITAAGGANPPATLTGTGVTRSLPAAPIVYAGDYHYPSDYDYSAHLDPDAVYAPKTAPTTPAEIAQAERECDFPFPPNTFPGGAIVVCDRGTIARVQKAVNVSYDWTAHPGQYTSGTAGAAGYVLANTTDMNTMYDDSYVVPGVQLDYQDGQALKNWLVANPGSDPSSPTNPPNPALTATIGGAVQSHDPAQADFIAGFSSRGPAGTVFDNLVKPDLAAPGVNVLAATSNPAYTDGASGGANQPQSYAFMNGTSMATPHVTGAGALLMQLHPAWTPAEIKSALMLTAVVTPLRDACASLDADQVCVAGNAVPSPQVRGAGRIDIDHAARTGLIMNIAADDYDAANPLKDGDLTALNLPSLANNDCVLTCRWTRTFTSALAGVTASYAVSVSGATSGLDVTVSPTAFTLAPGASRTVTFTADVAGLPVKQWAFAQIDVASNDNGDDGQPIPPMHLPLAVEPQPPMPTMAVMPASLSLSVKQGQAASATLNIADTGPGDLDWNLATSGNSATVAVWDQPWKGSTGGFPSAVYTGDGHGIYSADHFSMPVAGTVTKISADGFAQSADQTHVTVSQDATAIDWYIYEDAGGQPVGNPENGLNDYIWHYHSTPTGAGIDTTAGDYHGGIVLDLAAAGQAPVQLKKGKYWLIVDVTFGGSYSDKSAPSWYWFVSKKVDDASTGALILDPGKLLKQGAEIYTAGSSLAYTLTGTFNCSSNNLAGLHFSERSGTIKAGSAQNVDVTFDAGTTAPGSYTAPLCVTGNDPHNPVAAVPLSVTVTSAPITPGDKTASGGGGGAVGWFVLLLWSLAAGAAFTTWRGK